MRGGRAHDQVSSSFCKVDLFNAFPPSYISLQSTMSMRMSKQGLWPSCFEPLCTSKSMILQSDKKYLLTREIAATSNFYLFFSVSRTLVTSEIITCLLQGFTKTFCAPAAKNSFTSSFKQFPVNPII